MDDYQYIIGKNINCKMMVTLDQNVTSTSKNPSLAPHIKLKKSVRKICL